MAKAAKLKILYGEGDVDAQAETSAAFEKAGTRWRRLWDESPCRRHWIKAGSTWWC